MSFDGPRYNWKKEKAHTRLPKTNHKNSKTYPVIRSRKPEPLPVEKQWRVYIQWQRDYNIKKLFRTFQTVKFRKILVRCLVFRDQVRYIYK